MCTRKQATRPTPGGNHALDWPSYAKGHTRAAIKPFGSSQYRLRSYASVARRLGSVRARSDHLPLWQGVRTLPLYRRTSLLPMGRGLRRWNYLYVDPCFNDLPRSESSVMPRLGSTKCEKAHTCARCSLWPLAGKDNHQRPSTRAPGKPYRPGRNWISSRLRKISCDASSRSSNAAASSSVSARPVLPLTAARAAMGR